MDKKLKNVDQAKSENLDVSDLFVKQLVSCLKANKIKRGKFAEEIGISPDTIYAWTSTKKRPQWVEVMCKMFRFLILNIKEFDPQSLFFDEVDFNKLKEEQDNYKKNRVKIKKIMSYQGFWALKPYINSKFLSTPEEQSLIPLLTSKRFCECVTKMREIENNLVKLSAPDRALAQKNLRMEIYDVIRDMLKIDSYRTFIYH